MHEKLEPDERKIFRDRMSKATTVAELQAVAKDLDEVISQPF